jgi:protoheme ferro-lyase
MTYPYTFIAFMCDHYETLVEQSRSAKELDVRLEAWLYWKTMLINYSN